MISRTEHIAWCKERALERCQAGEPMEAITSFLSDMLKEEETANHPAIELCGQLMLSGNMSQLEEVQKFIEGFE